MIRQDDVRIKNKWIKKFGCAFMSVLFFVNKFTNLKLSPAKIEIYLGQMTDANCFTADMDIMWKAAFAFFNMKVSVKVVDDPKYKLKKNEFAIAKWHNDKTGFSHFTPTENGVCLMDPLGTSLTVRDGSIQSYRIFKILK